MTHPITIRRAGREDAETVFSLIVALADFEQLAPPDDAAMARFREHGWGARPRFEVWLAEWDGRPAGYALLFETYSTFLCQPTLYLEDLFVLPQFRGKGLGGALLRHGIGLARERGCGRMEWTCLDWNTNAQSVYDALGAERRSEWLLYRLTGDALAEGSDAPE